MQELLFGYTVQTHILALILGSTRLLMFAIVAPFMGSAVLSGSLRTAIIFSLYLVVHPLILTQVPENFSMNGPAMTLFIGLVLKEAFIGFVFGYLAGLIFWTLESVGFFIDNQRGAGMASEVDPLTGDQSSPTGSFLFQSLVYAFFATGTFLTFIGLLYSSYLVLPVNRFIPTEFFFNQGAVLFFGKSVANLATQTVLLSAPVVLACLFTDVALGLVNRFAPQLNVYILAMPIKSALASLLLIFYFALLMTDVSTRFMGFDVDLKTLKAFLP